jgi:hypothetical protein
LIATPENATISMDENLYSETRFNAAKARLSMPRYLAWAADSLNTKYESQEKEAWMVGSEPDHDDRAGRGRHGSAFACFKTYSRSSSSSAPEPRIHAMDRDDINAGARKESPLSGPAGHLAPQSRRGGQRASVKILSPGPSNLIALFSLHNK